VNDIPHIGHAYTTVAADILARYNRLLGNDVFFLTALTSTAEGRKGSARRKGRFAERAFRPDGRKLQGLWTKLGISNDAFIRTTDEEHKKTCRVSCRCSWTRGEIEKRSYAGWYCHPDERF